MINATNRAILEKTRRLTDQLCSIENIESKRERLEINRFLKVAFLHMQAKENATLPVEWLLPIEVALLQALSDCFSLKQIAEYFNYSESYLKQKKKSAMKKLGSHRIEHAIKVALQKELIT